MSEEKEIIIDGVNVAGCYYIETSKDKKYAACSCIDIRDCEGDIDTLLTSCEEHPNCHYKQLKRKEEENEVQKMALEAAIKENGKLKDEVKQIGTDFIQKGDYARDVEQQNKNLREAMHKDFCGHYVLGECSQEHHGNCVGRNQCIKDLEHTADLYKAALKEVRKKVVHASTQWDSNEYNMVIRELVKTQDFIDEVLK